MGTVAEVLKKYRETLTEEDIALKLEGALRGLPAPGSAALSGAEVDYVANHAGPGAAEVVDTWDLLAEREEPAI